ncbi:uncharacterized protein UTRI_03053 [Ustilago trichophora]|uniref:Uncharacterized protein n=1 Tax=Ustilago trichophora TaxID=86804 RepID=A0A5C3E5I8_9BASI|nr:uncharacterized protein UTRI_03053 [Ustilago trichophora]
MLGMECGRTWSCFVRRHWMPRLDELDSRRESKAMVLNDETSDFVIRGRETKRGLGWTTSSSAEGAAIERIERTKFEFYETLRHQFKKHADLRRRPRSKVVHTTRLIPIRSSGIHYVGLSHSKR